MAAGTEAKSPPLIISAIHATFVPPAFETVYHVAWTLPENDKVEPTVEWRLHLQIVGGDAGKPSPDSPGSGGAVDPGCSNAGVGIQAPFDGSKPTRRQIDFKAREIVTFATPFTWHHPDPAESDPPGRYHCNHLLMGPHGHQGLITVTVTLGHYQCRASYLGTNTGTGRDRSQRPFGEPTCRTLR
jgi:hypothetical protein